MNNHIELLHNYFIEYADRYLESHNNHYLKQLDVIDIYIKANHKKMDTIIVPSKDIQNRFNDFFDIKNTQVLQDTRYFQIQHRINKNLSPIPDWIKNDNIIILGSIDIKDWRIIKESLLFIKNEGLKLIIVPHEIDKNFISKMLIDLKEHHFIIKRDFF